MAAADICFSSFYDSRDDSTLRSSSTWRYGNRSEQLSMMRKHTTQASGDRISRQKRPQAGEHVRKRTQVACERCRKRKIKCSGPTADEGCETCGDAGERCVINRVGSKEWEFDLGVTGQFTRKAAPTHHDDPIGSLLPPLRTSGVSPSGFVRREVARPFTGNRVTTPSSGSFLTLPHGGFTGHTSNQPTQLSLHSGNYAGQQYTYNSRNVFDISDQASYSTSIGRNDTLPAINEHGPSQALQQRTNSISGARRFDRSLEVAVDGRTGVTGRPPYDQLALDVPQTATGLRPPMITEIIPPSHLSSPTTSTSSYREAPMAQPMRLPSFSSDPQVMMHPYSNSYTGMPQSSSSFSGQGSTLRGTLGYSRRPSYGYGPHTPSPLATSTPASYMPSSHPPYYGYSPVDSYTYSPYYTPGSRTSSVSGAAGSGNEWLPYNYGGASATQHRHNHHHRHRHGHAAPTANMSATHSHGHEHVDWKQGEPETGLETNIDAPGAEESVQ